MCQISFEGALGLQFLKYDGTFQVATSSAIPHLNPHPTAQKYNYLLTSETICISFPNSFEYIKLTRISTRWCQTTIPYNLPQNNRWWNQASHFAHAGEGRTPQLQSRQKLQVLERVKGALPPNLMLLLPTLQIAESAQYCNNDSAPLQKGSLLT